MRNFVWKFKATPMEDKKRTISALSVKFSVHVNPLKDDQGHTTYQVRQDTLGTIDTKGLETKLGRYHTANNFNLEGAVIQIQQLLIEMFQFNHRVHLNGLGTFSLSIGLKPVIDEDDTQHKRIVTDPNKITGNEIEVTGINFVPDKELMTAAKSKLVYFEHSARRGSVGHSESYSDEEMRQSLIDWFAENDYLTCSLFMKMWHLTRYKADKLLTQLCEGDDALLVVQKQANAYIYRLNPNLTRP